MEPYIVDPTGILTSVKINGVEYRFRELQRRLSMFSGQLICVNDDAGRDINLFGSMANVRLGEKYLCVCTQHQLGNTEISKVCIHNFNRTRFVSAGAYYFVKSSHAGQDLNEIEDLCAFDFTEAVNNLGVSPARFLDISEHSAIRPSAGESNFVVCGHAHKDVSIDLMDDCDYSQGIRSIASLCRCNFYSLVSETGDRDLVTLRSSSLPEKFNADGFSGAPVFGLSIRQARVVLSFAGIVTRGGNGYVHVVPGDRIKACIQDFLTN